MKSGKGVFRNDKTGIIYEGEFLEDNETILPNQVKYVFEAKEEVVEEEDIKSPRGKQKKGGKGKLEEEVDTKLYYEVGKEPLVNFKCEIIYQGPDYEDPDGYNEEELEEF